MIRVSIDLIAPGKIEPLGRMMICNDGTSPIAGKGNYHAYCARKSDVRRGFAKWMDSPCRTGRVEEYPRLSYNVWRLIARCVLSCFPEEKR